MRKTKVEHRGDPRQASIVAYEHGQGNLRGTPYSGRKLINDALERLFSDESADW